MVNQNIFRFDIRLVQLYQTQDSEIKKQDLALFVISPDEMFPLKTVIVAPMTTENVHCRHC